MKKTLLLTAAASLAVSASAVSLPVKPDRLSSLRNPQGRTMEMANLLAAQKGVKRLNGAELDKSAVSRRVPQKKADAVNDIIGSVPAGAMSEWSKSCEGWYSMYGYLRSGEMEGRYQQMVEAEDGSVYMNMHVTNSPIAETWVKGSKDASGNISIPSGQLVYEEEYLGETYSYGMVALSFRIDYVANKLYYDPIDALEMSFDAASGTYTTSEEVLWGLCQWDSDYEDWAWTGFGDCGIRMAEVKETAETVPEGLQTEKWALVNNDAGSGHFVSVGFDNADVWVKGLFAANPDAWMKGSIDPETGKAVFAPGQFLGVSTNYIWNYLYGGTTEKVWDDYWEEYVDAPVITGDLVFNYDSRGQRLIPENCAYAVTGRAASEEDYASLSVADYILDFSICLQHRDPAALPTAPYDLDFDDSYFESDGDSDFYFSISPFDVNGDLLDTDNLYFRFYVDGEVFTFYDDEYPGVDEDGQELVNVNFETDNMFVSGSMHGIYVYATGFESAGIQAVYLQPSEDGGEPTELCSEIAAFNLGTDAVKTIDAKASSSAFFDLQGRKAGAGSDKGIYIRVEKMADGSAKAVKVAR